MHQSVKVSNLMQTDVLIDLRPLAILKLHTLRDHSILRVDVGRKPQKLLILRSIFSNRHAPLLEVQELGFLLIPQIFRKVLLQELTLEPRPSDNITTSLNPPLGTRPSVLSLLSKHISSQPNLLIIISHHSTKDPLHALLPSQSSFWVKPPLERRRFVSHETIKPPLLHFSMVFLTMTTVPLSLSQH